MIKSEDSDEDEESEATGELGRRDQLLGNV
jgi:hypothetical protein